jgi:hypothetical protein
MRRTCTTLRRRFTFPPDVLLLVLIRIFLIPLILIPLHRLRVVFRRLMACGLLARRCSGRRVRCRRGVANRRAGTAHAFRAEPFAIWDGGQGRGETRVVISFIALCSEGERREEESGGIERLPCRTQVDHRSLCGISCSRLACPARRDVVAGQSISRSGSRGRMSYFGPQ